MPRDNGLLPVDVRLYLARNGKTPFEHWLEGLKDSMTRARIKARVNRLRLGNFGDSKSVGQGVFELRLDFGPGYRIYFGRASSMVLLLCGGSKKSQPADIEEAKRYWNDYQKLQKASKE